VTLAGLLAAAALELPQVVVTTGPDGTVTWSRGDRAFAMLAPDGAAAYALDPAVAAAAARTPDTTLSGLGAGWIRFAPKALDEHAADRAIAWFVSAHRRAAPRD
jgi:hypothetical protein